jgi:hypothetical protein
VEVPQTELAAVDASHDCCCAPAAQARCRRRKRGARAVCDCCSVTKRVRWLRHSSKNKTEPYLGDNRKSFAAGDYCSGRVGRVAASALCVMRVQSCKQVGSPLEVPKNIFGGKFGLGPFRPLTGLGAFTTESWYRFTTGSEPVAQWLLQSVESH